MKLAILSESPADEAAIAVLIEAVLGRRFTRVQPSLRARGWPSVAQVLPSIIRHLHFNTDADGLVVVVDSDDSVVHTEVHDAPGYYHPLCRLCQLRAIFRQTMKKLPPARGRERVLRGVGVAVPAVEAWYLCGLEDSVTEARWLAGQVAQRAPYTRRELKWRTYGTDRPTLQHETEIALREARRHAHDTRRLENDFPGFASLAADLKTWPKVG
ncbi:MAG: hypothetical protein WC205_03435 [Opitutaceae bacterium]|jgi:hypothetical protein